MRHKLGRDEHPTYYFDAAAFRQLVIGPKRCMHGSTGCTVGGVRSINFIRKENGNGTAHSEAKDSQVLGQVEPPPLAGKQVCAARKSRRLRRYP